MCLFLFFFFPFFLFLFQLPKTQTTKGVRKMQQVKKTNQIWDLRYLNFRQHIGTDRAVISIKRFLAGSEMFYMGANWQLDKLWSPKIFAFVFALKKCMFWTFLWIPGSNEHTVLCTCQALGWDCLPP